MSARKNELQRTLVKISQSSALQKIYSALGSESELHIVGGIFRKLILESNPGDLDLATVLHPEIVIQKLTDAGHKTYPTGITHGTITAMVDEIPFEITTFRKPGDRLGSEFSKNISEDLSGRDFTVNSVAFSFASLQIIDPYEGINDVFSLNLKAVGTAAERFREDPLRILRAVRFLSQENFTPDAEIQLATRKLSNILKDVSPERISAELCKILIGRNVRAAFEWMREYGLLAVVFPEILPCVGFQQNKFHIEDVYNHTLTVVENSYPSVKIRLAALFHDLGKPESLTVGADGERHFYNHEDISARIARDTLPRFKLSAALAESVINLVALHMRPIQCGPAGVRRLMRDLGNDFEDWLLLKRADKTPVQNVQMFEKEFNEFLKLHLAEKEKQKDPVYGKLAINGDDLIEIGIPEGKKIGKILRQIEDEVIEKPEINLKDILIKRAKELNEA